MSSFLPRFALVLTLCSVFAVGTALAQAPEEDPEKPPGPGEGGDSVLPAGYSRTIDEGRVGVVWGINDVAMQHVLAQPLEMAPGMDHHRHWLIDTPPTNDIGLSQKGVVKFHFWDGQLFEVKMYYNLSAGDGKALLARFEERYGTARHDVVKATFLKYGESEPGVSAELWKWTDPFTLQVLRRDLKGEKWSMIRQSRVLEERRLAQERVERAEKRENKIDSIDID
jgi:hypothetical protein